MSGEKVGPLHGVPVSMKNMIPTKGLRTTFGSKVYKTLFLMKMIFALSVLSILEQLSQEKPKFLNLVIKELQTIRYLVLLKPLE